MVSLLTNTTAMTALTTLKSISRQLDVTSHRVSTGQRVASAADNAAYWSIATTIRTDNASLGAVKDTLGLSSSAVDIGYNGYSSIIPNLQNLRAKLQAALTPGVDRTQVQTEISAIQKSMRAIADSSVFSGQNWLSVNSASVDYKKTELIAAGFSRSSEGNTRFSNFEIVVDDIKLYDLNASPGEASGSKARISSAVSLVDTSGFGSGRGTANFSGTSESALKLTVGSSSDIIHINHTNIGTSVGSKSAITPDEFLAAINSRINASLHLSGKVIAGLDTGGRLYFESTVASAVEALKLESASVIYGNNLIDVGFSTNAGSPVLVPDNAFTSIDLSTTDLGLALLSFAYENDDDVYNFVHLNGANYIALGAAATSSSVTAINGADLVTMINNALLDQDSRVRAFYEDNKIKFVAGISGAQTYLNIYSMVYPKDFSDIGYIPSNRVDFGANAEIVVYGEDAVDIERRGILDTDIGSYSIEFGGANYSVDTLNVSQLIGAVGDADLERMISAVDKILDRVIQGGTKLGAYKAQIIGQNNFIDALIKVNSRSIGILIDADAEEESTKLRALETLKQLSLQSLSIANSVNQNLLSLFR